jgi:hypothetical protein
MDIKFEIKKNDANLLYIELIDKNVTLSLFMRDEFTLDVFRELLHAIKNDSTYMLPHINHLNFSMEYSEGVLTLMYYSDDPYCEMFYESKLKRSDAIILIGKLVDDLK